MMMVIILDLYFVCSLNFVSVKIRISTVFLLFWFFFFSFLTLLSNITVDLYEYFFFPPLFMVSHWGFDQCNENVRKTRTKLNN